MVNEMARKNTIGVINFTLLLRIEKYHSSGYNYGRNAHDFTTRRIPLEIKENANGTDSDCTKTRRDRPYLAILYAVLLDMYFSREIRAYCTAARGF